MRYLKVHEDFLKEHKDLPRKELTRLFNEKFKSNVSQETLKQKCIKLRFLTANKGCFQKGHTPFNKGLKGYTGANKTSFTKGNVPANTKTVGTIVTRKDKKGWVYKYIKIAEPNKWELLHVHIYKQKHGEVPKGYCVIFKDKNRLNLSIDNLMLIKRCELARLNQKYSDIHHSLKETALQLIKINEAIRKNKKIFNE